jgi:hypothetical protein
MQAAMGRSADRSPVRRISPLAPAGVASPAVYTVAVIELYSRLWQALEELTGAFARFGPAGGEVERQVVVLRLELVVLLDTFESLRARSLLRPEQRAELAATVHYQLDALAAQPGAGAGPALARAQNQLLDAVLRWV